MLAGITMNHKNWNLFLEVQIDKHREIINIKGRIGLSLLLKFNAFSNLDWKLPKYHESRMTKSDSHISKLNKLDGVCMQLSKNVPQILSFL